MISGNLVPLSLKAYFRFYEPLVLLKALNVAMTKAGEYTGPDINERPRELRQQFEAFVNKLALMCNSQKGGNTITSLAVLQHDAGGSFEFLFASNQRGTEELETTAAFIRVLLNVIATVSSEQRDDLFAIQEAVLLHHILSFNEDRVVFYVKQLKIFTPQCVLNTVNDVSHINNRTTRRSEVTAALLELARVVDSADEQFVKFGYRARDADAAIRQLAILRRSAPWEVIEALAHDGRASGQKSLLCWSEVRHMVNRLVAYLGAVDYFMFAGVQWPQLFRNSRVSYVKSSEPSRKPAREKSFSAEKMMGRITSDAEKMRLYRKLVTDLQLFDLDNRIIKEYKNDAFRPIVHCEILLHDAIVQGGPLTPHRFFFGWMYIGTSKPTCRLCHYYFEEHGSGIEYRKGHGNLYIAWRFPDVLEAQGKTAVARRQTMINKMTARLRRDAIDLVLRRCVPLFKKHDSLTSTAELTSGLVGQRIHDVVWDLSSYSEDDEF